MQHVQIERAGSIRQITLCRGKVNALNPEILADLHSAFDSIRGDETVRAVILTGRGSFFSFGFDIPEFLTYSRDDFRAYLQQFTDFYTDLFVYAKPVVAALNGHAVAGGCMLATACDYRVMVSGKAKIGLNEVTFGASLFAGSVKMLRQLVGGRNAERIALLGQLVTADEAAGLGLVDRVCPPEELSAVARRVAEGFAQSDRSALASVKRLLREPIAQRMRRAEPASIEEFLDIWYSKSTQTQLEKIKIRS